MELRVQDLQVSYGKRNILQGVSLLFSQGLHFVAGLNGSGKTSLFRAIDSAIPFSGKIILDGKDLNSLKAQERAKLIAVVAQNSSTPFPVKLNEFVLMGRFPWLGWLGNYSSEDISIADQCMDDLELGSLKNQLIGELSGGELQKAFLARALCQKSPVMLLDEPEASLDPRNKKLLLELLQRFSTGGKLVICSTHEPSFLHSANCKVSALRNGEVAWNGQPVEDWEKWNEWVYS